MVFKQCFNDDSITADLSGVTVFCIDCWGGDKQNQLSRNCGAKLQLIIFVIETSGEDIGSHLFGTIYIGGEPLSSCS